MVTTHEADAVSFAARFIANPDLVSRLALGHELPVAADQVALAPSSNAARRRSLPSESDKRRISVLALSAVRL